MTPADLRTSLCTLLLVGDSVVQLSGHGSLEEQVQAAVPDWQQAFCSTSGRSNGLPSCLLISPAALGAIAMIKSFPAFNKVLPCGLDKFLCNDMHSSQQQYRLCHKDATAYADTKETGARVGVLPVSCLHSPTDFSS